MNDSESSPSAVYRFTFTGRTGEYFRIWVVSLFLSIVTLGIYSAWGKVRKKRYLYARTMLEGTGFEYRASPVAILKGRAVALCLFGGFALAGHFVPWVQLALGALLIVLLPWIVVASSRFNARNSTWRNIAFGFDGSLREATKVLLGFGLAALATFGIAYPWYRMRRARFILEHHRFGATRFGADLSTGDFLVAYLLAFIAMVGILVIFAAGIGISFWAARDADGVDVEPEFVTYIPLVLLYAAYVVWFAFLRARIANVTLNGLIAGPLRCRSMLRGRDLAWLYLSNIVAILATLGLATAWVTIRMARYRAERLWLVGSPSPASFLGAAAGSATATGSEVSDLFDVDVSL